MSATLSWKKVGSYQHFATQNAHWTPLRGKKYFKSFNPEM
jgi:hypothetical protein